MKAHILNPFAREAKSPFVKEVRRRWPEATFHFGALPALNYRKRAWLYFVGWPRLMAFAIRAGRRIFGAGIQADVVVCNSDLEVIGLALTRFAYKQPVPIVLAGFILTPRDSAIVDAIRKVYFRFVLRQARAVLCYSSFEARHYRALFGTEKTNFASVPYGLHVWNPGLPETPSSPDYVLSAGRSARDYELLVRVCAKLSCRLHIVCDSKHALRGLALSPNVSVLRHCYGNDYLKQIVGADVVVIPLTEKDFSAGQMVLLQAMALGKPVVITRTATTEEYGKHLETVYFVERGSAEDLEEAIMRLKRDRDLAASLGRRAREHFQQRHSMAPFVQGLVDVIENVVSDDTSRRSHDEVEN